MEEENPSSPTQEIQESGSNENQEERGLFDRLPEDIRPLPRTFFRLLVEAAVIVFFWG